MIFGFILLLCFGLVSAGTCSNADQTIMKLYGASNSHGALWNDAAYTYDICYDDIFGSTYSGGATSHGCIGANRVLSLSSDTNAHVSEIKDVNYNVDVCYGDLMCDYEESSGDSCANGGKVVARISSESNAHISDASDTNYPIKVCCQNTPVLPDLYWADANGVRITEANLGDTVKMIYSGTETTFEIYEEDTLTADDSIRTGENAIVGTIEGDKMVGIWTITQADLDKTANFEGFYFVINGQESSHLQISEDEDEDDPMDIDISGSSFKCGDHFDEGTIGKVIVLANDDDDIIEGNVTIDGVIKETFSNGGITFDYPFDEPGELQIRVDAENTKGGKKRIISNIMILDVDAGNYVPNKDYAAACIYKPEDFSNILDNPVIFDASTTRGVMIDNAGVLNEFIPGINKFNWYWKFFNSGIEVGNKTELGSTAIASYKFSWNFDNAGEKSATLEVDIA